MVETLRELLALAEVGDVEGHCFVVKLRGEHRAGVTGDYQRSTGEALQAIFYMERYLAGPLPPMFGESRL